MGDTLTQRQFGLRAESTVMRVTVVLFTAAVPQIGSAWHTEVALLDEPSGTLRASRLL